MLVPPFLYPQEEMWPFGLVHPLFHRMRAMPVQFVDWPRF